MKNTKINNNTVFTGVPVKGSTEPWKIENSPKKKQTKILKYPTFRTMCYKCGKSLQVTQFTVHAGTQSFALCPKHLDELIKLYK